MAAWSEHVLPEGVDTSKLSADTTIGVWRFTAPLSEAGLPKRSKYDLLFFPAKARQVRDPLLGSGAQFVRENKEYNLGAPGGRPLRRLIPTF